LRGPVHQVLKQVTMRPCWALMAVFDEPLLEDWDAAFVNDGALAWVCSQRSKPGRPPASAWVLHATPEWSEAHLELAAGEAAERLLEAARPAGAVVRRAAAGAGWRLVRGIARGGRISERSRCSRARSRLRFGTRRGGKVLMRPPRLNAFLNSARRTATISAVRLAPYPTSAPDVGTPTPGPTSVCRCKRSRSVADYSDGINSETGQCSMPKTGCAPARDPNRRRRQTLCARPTETPA
jgi:hypothetical protein